MVGCTPHAVSVLGTEYSIEILSRDKDETLKNADGYCDPSGKRIVILDFDSVKGDAGYDGVADLDWCRRRVLRHEIIHAFLTESGLRENSHEPESWGISEEIVDWIALQHHKIQQAFVDAECAETVIQ